MVMTKTLVLVPCFCDVIRLFFYEALTIRCIFSMLTVFFSVAELGSVAADYNATRCAIAHIGRTLPLVATWPLDKVIPLGSKWPGTYFDYIRQDCSPWYQWNGLIVLISQHPLVVCMQLTDC